MKVKALFTVEADYIFNIEELKKDFEENEETFCKEKCIKNITKWIKEDFDRIEGRIDNVLTCNYTTNLDIKEEN